jgi:hypothetical protein
VDFLRAPIGYPARGGGRRERRVTTDGRRIIIPG